MLPYAAPGVFTGTILALARAFGETAPLLLVGAVTGYLTPGGRRPDRDAPGQVHGAPDDHLLVVRGSRARSGQQLTAAAIVVLLAVILVVNLAAILLRNRYERKW